MIKKSKSRISRSVAHRKLFKLLRAKNEHRELLEARIVPVNTVCLKNGGGERGRGRGSRGDTLVSKIYVIAYMDGRKH